MSFLFTQGILRGRVIVNRLDLAWNHRSVKLFIIVDVAIRFDSCARSLVQ